MFYNNYFGGMHFFWWVFWVMMLIWVFAIPYNIPGQRFKVDSPLDTLKKRLASGQITTEQYQEMKKTLEID
ncbi:MAG: SHOCT domain-containing protein [Bacteroidia bacterium]